MRPISDDSVNGAVLSGATYVFILRLPVVVGEEGLVGDGVHVHVSWGLDRRSDEVRFVAFSVGGEGTEQFLGLIKGFFDGNGFLSPVDRGVDVSQPGES